MISHSISKLCILEAAIAWVITFVGLSNMKVNIVVKYSVSLLTRRDIRLHSISAQGKQLAH